MIHTRGTRLASAVFVMASLFATLASPALAVESRKVKEIKRALVRLEHRLDDAHASAKLLQRRLRSLEADVRAARGVARPVHAHDGLVGFPLLSGLVRFAMARFEEAEARRRIARLQRGMRTVIFERKETIDDLQEIVERKLERLPSPFRAGGSLITYSADWEATAQCESNGDWDINSSKDGGLQFLPATWLGFGGGEIARHAFQASKLEQISIAERVLVIQGPGAWPTCFTPLPASF